MKSCNIYKSKPSLELGFFCFKLLKFFNQTKLGTLLALIFSMQYFERI
ncbi:hypothetical protein G3L11_001779 [Campylobacter jejuni]|nr:hypothetical protein [Campylobacter jejuni]